jgi:hypothetical protein
LAWVNTACSHTVHGIVSRILIGPLIRDRRPRGITYANRVCLAQMTPMNPRDLVGDGVLSGVSMAGVKGAAVGALSVGAVIGFGPGDANDLTGLAGIDKGRRKGSHQHPKYRGPT